MRIVVSRLGAELVSLNQSGAGIFCILYYIAFQGPRVSRPHRAPDRAIFFGLVSARGVGQAQEHGPRYDGRQPGCQADYTETFRNERRNNSVECSLDLKAAVNETLNPQFASSVWRSKSSRMD